MWCVATGACCLSDIAGRVSLMLLARFVCGRNYADAKIYTKGCAEVVSPYHLQWWLLLHPEYPYMSRQVM